MHCILFLVEEFSEWDSTCQNCTLFKKCRAEYAKQNKKQTDENYGENYPDYNIIHLRTLINKERTEMIEKLLIEEMGRITKDDIMDFIIDIEIYNRSCKRKKINNT